MPYLKNGNARIYYEVHGTNEGRSPLLLTHGYSSTSEMWKGQVEELSKSFRLVVWDMRGHGLTEVDPADDQTAYSERTTMSDMSALLDHVVADPDEKVVVGGLSLGGYMSLAFYRSHPERVKALLIIDTGPGFKKDSARDAWNETAFATADKFSKGGLEVLRSMSAERASVNHRSAHGLVMAARGMLTQRDSSVIDSLAAVKVPALVVVGAEDKPFLAASQYMTNKIPGAKKVVVPDAGHAVNIDQPKRFLEAVMPFLNEVENRQNEPKAKALL